mgnify:FL=1
MSPLAHSVAGIWLAARREGGFKPRHLLWAPLVALLPDFDLLVGWLLAGKRGLELHQRYTHTLLFALAASLLISLLLRRPRLFPLILLLLLSHLLLDLVVTDRKPPIGIPLFSPFSSKTFSLGLFPGIRKASWAELFSTANLLTVLGETFLFLPLLLTLLRRGEK